MNAEDAVLDGTRYRRSGTGKSVVLIHGVGADLEMWEPVANQLACEHDVLRYDMQGHGASTKPPGPYALNDFVQQLRRLVDGLRVQRFTLAGFSMGGLVAQGFALAEPARLERLVLLNTVYDRSSQERAAVEGRVREVLDGGLGASISAAIDRWFTPDFRARRPEVIAAIRRRMETNDVRAYAAAYSVFATADRDLSGRIGEITAPTMVATGADDQRSTPAMAVKMAALLKSGCCRILPGQRHMTPLEVPEVVAALIAGQPQTAQAELAAQ